MYIPYGFKYFADDPSVCACNRPLQLRKKFKCSNVFQTWLAQSTKKHSIYKVPTKEIPVQLKSKYLLKGYISLKKWYVDGTSRGQLKRMQTVWTSALIDSYAVNMEKRYFANISYGFESGSFLMFSMLMITFNVIVSRLQR